jgi:hypothetical protein
MARRAREWLSDATIHTASATSNQLVLLVSCRSASDFVILGVFSTPRATLGETTAPRHKTRSRGSACETAEESSGTGQSGLHVELVAVSNAIIPV